MHLTINQRQSYVRKLHPVSFIKSLHNCYFILVENVQMTVIVMQSKNYALNIALKRKSTLCVPNIVLQLYWYFGFMWLHYIPYCGERNIYKSLILSFRSGVAATFNIKLITPTAYLSIRNSVVVEIIYYSLFISSNRKDLTEFLLYKNN